MAGLPPHFRFRPVINDQHTAARAYFLCVLGMLFLESLVRIIPALTHVFLSRRRKQDSQRSPKHHFAITVWIHKLLTQPSPFPILTTHTAASIIRCLVFIGLNILFGWNRIRYTTDYQLYGWLTLANGGLALLLPTRTNLFSLIARIPSPILLSYHRWAGVATVIHATLHFSLTAQHYARTHQLDTVLENQRIRVGIVAWAALALMFLTSIRIIRRRAFEVFYYIHFIFIVFIAGAFYHAAYAAEFLVPGLVLWVIDRAVRVWYSNFRAVNVTGVTQYPGDVTKLRFEGKMLSPRPGQIVWVQIPGVSLLNWHPFTIIPSLSATRDGNMSRRGSIAIRGLGGYTKKVMEHFLEANAASETSHSTCDSSNTPPDSNNTIKTITKTNQHELGAQSIKIRLDGPYGVGRLSYAQYPVIILVAGGIGITPAMSIVTHLVNEAVKHKSPPCSCSASSRCTHMHQQQHIHLLWTVKDVHHLSWFEEDFAALVSTTQSQNLPVTLHISIYVTGNAKDQEEQRLGGGGASDMYEYTGPGKIHNGRPNLTEWFQHVKASLRPGLGDVAVNLCGPRPLVRSARKAALRVSNMDGLFLVEEEEFEF